MKESIISVNTTFTKQYEWRLTSGGHTSAVLKSGYLWIDGKSRHTQHIRAGSKQILWTDFNMCHTLVVIGRVFLCSSSLLMQFESSYAVIIDNAYY